MSAKQIHMAKWNSLSSMLIKRKYPKITSSFKEKRIVINDNNLFAICCCWVNPKLKDVLVFLELSKILL